MFALRSRSRPLSQPEAGADWPDHVRTGLPPRFEAVAEALASGSGPLAGYVESACSEAGTQMAKDGASLEETLEALVKTFQLLRGTEPSYAALRALSVAWSEASMVYLHQLACEDPMTGLSSLAHLRTRLSELYRGELRGSGRVRDTHALVVAELPSPPHDEPPDSVRAKHVLTRAMQLADLGEAARTVFAGTETIGRLGPDRIAVLADRDDRLGQRVALLRRMARTLQTTDQQARVWIEGLPGTDPVAGLLLDELARG